VGPGVKNVGFQKKKKKKKKINVLYQAQAKEMQPVLAGVLVNKKH
jgi:hypothetical protein